MMNQSWLPMVWLALLVAAGCGEVEHCTESKELGCLNAAPRRDGTCFYDLVPYKLEAGTRCLEPGGQSDPCQSCAEGSLCVPEEGKCVSFCEMPAVLPGSGTSPEAIFCQAVSDPAKPGVEPPMLSFEEVCRRRCRLECQRVEQLCGAGCPDGTCDRPEVQLECLRDCPRPTATGGRDLACLTRSCEDQRLSRCDPELACPNGNTVDCSQVTCTNDCAHADDGSCDDGDIVSSDRSDCAWGSDCADCGVRKDAPSPGYLGNVCQYHSNCDGGTRDPRTAAAWCVESKTIMGSARCMPDCSRGQDCADGFGCHEVTFDTDGREGGASAPIVEGGVRSRACLPLQCI